MVTRIKLSFTLACMLCGCQDATVEQRTATQIDIAAPLIDVKELAPGPRPKAILGAIVCDFHEFHQQKHSTEEWICLEGTVTATGEAMGAAFVNLKCNKCDFRIHCEDGSFRSYRIPIGTNLMIRGHYTSYLGSPAIVSQQEIDAAIAEEAGMTDSADESTKQLDPK